MKKGRLIFILILGTVLLGGLVMLGIYEYDNYITNREYAEAEELSETETPAEPQPTEPPAEKPETPPEEDPEPTPEPIINTYTDPNIDLLMDTDLDSLREVNEDVLGWIFVPDTKINYPILQSVDNEYYLKHTWKDTSSGAGAIFLEYQNSPDFSDFNTIIYGHNMRSDSMFGGLSNYKKLSYWEEHPYVYIVNDYGIFRYDIFAAHRVRLDTIIYGMKINTPSQREEFISFSKQYSVIETGIEPTVEDSIVTLSTCSGGSYKTRWVVQAVLNQKESYRNPDAVINE